VANILLTTWGSHGDIDPFIGLGLALQARGHRASIATIDYFGSIVTSSGLGFHPLRPRVDPSQRDIVERVIDRRKGSEYLLRELMFPAVEDMFADVDAAAAGADLLISHPLTFATQLVAESRKLPWASVVLAPLSFFSRYDTPVFPPAPWLRALRHLGTWPGSLMVSLAKRATRGWQEPVSAMRRRLGLRPAPNPLWEGQHSPSLVLALFSTLLARPQPDWPPNVVVTGHPFHDAPHGTALVPELEAFLQDGPPPIVFTLGSSVVMVAGEFWQVSIAAAKSLGARAVLLTGPGYAEALRPSLPDGVIAVERAPHSLLFPRASVVVQPCGIGTLAQSLRSGRPMLAVPYAHDQFDNAWRAAGLGMARVLYPWKYRPAAVTRHLAALIQQGVYQEAADRTAAVVRKEPGLAGAAEAIERAFRI
jgi:UDP:flavonoid glycosyltransferase YjiC (YdhE family)